MQADENDKKEADELDWTHIMQRFTSEDHTGGKNTRKEGSRKIENNDFGLDERQRNIFVKFLRKISKNERIQTKFNMDTMN